MNNSLRHKMLQRLAEETADTYSSVMRDINKNTPEKMQEFMIAFKDAFDNGMDENIDDHREVALLEAKQCLSSVFESKRIKLAQFALSGAKTPEEVGLALSNVIKMLLKRVPHANAYENLRNKLSQIKPIEIATKKLPETAAYGQSITLIKTLLNGYSPNYVQQVLTATSKHLY